MIKWLRTQKQTKRPTRRKRETVDARNLGEQTAHQAEKAVKEHGDKVTPEEKALIETKIAELRENTQGRRLRHYNGQGQRAQRSTGKTRRGCLQGTTTRNKQKLNQRKAQTRRKM